MELPSPTPPSGRDSAAPGLGWGTRPGEEPWRRRAGLAYAAHLLTIFGLFVSNVFLALTLLLAPLALRRGAPWGILQTLRALYRPLALYVLLLGAAVLASHDPRRSAGSLTELVSLTTLALGPLLVRGERQVRRLVEALIVLGALVALHGLSQFLVGYGDIDLRIRGPFSHWMTFAGVLAICDLLLIARLALDPASRTWWRWAALAALNLGLLGSLTRSAWIAVALAVAGLFALRRPRHLLIGVPAALLFVMLAPVPLLSRVLSIADLRDTSNYDRLCMVEAGMIMVAERPLLGIGPDMVQSQYGLYRHPTAPRFWVPHLHNVVVHLAAERGLTSLAAYLWLMGASILLAWRRYRQQGGADGPRADLYLGTVLALVSFNMAGVFEYNWGDTEVQRLALFLLALPYCLEMKDESVAPDPDRS